MSACRKQPADRAQQPLSLIHILRIRGWGKSGHAAMPEGTVNAIGLVVNYLLDNGLCNDAERAYLEVLKKLHASTAGTGLGIDCADGPFGPLTIIGGRIFMREGQIGRAHV